MHNIIFAISKNVLLVFLREYVVASGLRRFCWIIGHNSIKNHIIYWTKRIFHLETSSQVFTYLGCIFYTLWYSKKKKDSQWPCLVRVILYKLLVKAHENFTKNLQSNRIFPLLFCPVFFSSCILPSTSYEVGLKWSDTSESITIITNDNVRNTHIFL